MTSQKSLILQILLSAAGIEGRKTEGRCPDAHQVGPARLSEAVLQSVARFSLMNQNATVVPFAPPACPAQAR